MSEPRRAELSGAPAAPESSTGAKTSGRAESSSDGKPSPKSNSGRKEKGDGCVGPDGEQVLGKPSDHDQGVWAGFMNIFRSEKRRATLTGQPSALLVRVAGGSTLPPNTVPAPMGCCRGGRI